MCGFHLKVLNVYNEYVNPTTQCLAHGIRLNIADANEHVPAIGRRIRVIKERMNESHLPHPPL